MSQGKDSAVLDVDQRLLYQKAVPYIIFFWILFSCFVNLAYWLVQSLGYVGMTPSDYITTSIRWLLWMIFSIHAFKRILLQSLQTNRLSFGALLFHFGAACATVFLVLLAEFSISRVVSQMLDTDNISFRDYLYGYLSRLQYYVLIYFAIIGSAHLIKYIHQLRLDERQKAQLQTQLHEQKLQLLALQIRPHFIFNAQHAIVSLMQSGEVEKASGMMVKLSSLLRKILHGSNTLTTSVKDEVEKLQLYVDLQQLRFSNLLQVTYFISQELLNKEIPVLILQPLVENVFHHAYPYFRHGGTLLISIQPLNYTEMEICIQDEGEGFDEDQLVDFGVGLTNVIERIQSLYGDSGKFQIKSREGEGTHVRIVIPQNTYE